MFARSLLLAFYALIPICSAVLTSTHSYEFLTAATNILDGCGSGPALAPISEI